MFIHKNLEEKELKKEKYDKIRLVKC